MTHIELATGHFIVVEVPEGANWISSLGKDGGTKTCVAYYLPDNPYPHYTEPVDGNWQLIGTTEQITKFDSNEQILKGPSEYRSPTNGTFWFKDYRTGLFNCSFPYSFQSLCQHHRRAAPQIPASSVWLRKEIAR